MALRATIALLFFANIKCATAELYANEAAVVDLTPGNFKLVMQADNRLWLLNFYTPWCGDCKNMVPDIVNAAKLAEKHNIKVGAVDCELPLNGELCGHCKNMVPDIVNAAKLAEKH